MSRETSSRLTHPVEYLRVQFHLYIHTRNILYTNKKALALLIVRTWKYFEVRGTSTSQEIWSPLPFHTGELGFEGGTRINSWWTWRRFLFVQRCFRRGELWVDEPLPGHAVELFDLIELPETVPRVTSQLGVRNLYSKHLRIHCFHVVFKLIAVGIAQRPGYHTFTVIENSCI